MLDLVTCALGLTGVIVNSHIFRVSKSPEKTVWAVIWIAISSLTLIMGISTIAREISYETAILIIKNIDTML